jgi:acetylornithine deacetylase/succinyl-diaminopimelate desuccinylase-like protein
MNVEQYVKSKRLTFITDLSHYIAIPSISAESKHKKDIGKAVQWISKRLIKAGFHNVKLLKTKGNPVVYGEHIEKAELPTVLFYGHYDVQPAEPLEEWKSDPFKLTVRKGDMFARGVSDNKAPHLSHVLGIEALLNLEKKLPINVKFLIEGEEEIGSLHVNDVLKNYKNLFLSTVAFVSDGIRLFDAPVIEYGLRGIVPFEVKVTCLSKDVHSGGYGGLVDNPVMVLAYIISQLKDRRGKIKIPHIYSSVRKVSEEERILLTRSEQKEKDILQETGARKFFGEKNYLQNIRTGARPSLDVNGIWGGFTGEGVKTIIPKEATAKLTMRLVPYQTVDKVKQLIRAYIKKVTPATCTVKLTFGGGCNPTLFDPKNPQFAIAQETLEEVFGAKVKFKLVGGSVGAVDAIKDVLGIDSILTGFSLPDCGMHSPNEKFPIDYFLKGITFTAYFLKNMACHLA